jgi:hypothetical protein
MKITNGRPTMFGLKTQPLTRIYGSRPTPKHSMNTGSRKAALLLMSHSLPSPTSQPSLIYSKREQFPLSPSRFWKTSGPDLLQQSATRD